MKKFKALIAGIGIAVVSLAVLPDVQHRSVMFMKMERSTLPEIVISRTRLRTLILTICPEMLHL